MLSNQDTIEQLLSDNPRLATMRNAVRIARERGAKTWVETGCFRGIPGDGYSTLVFAMAAAVSGGRLDSYDINPTHVQRATELVARYTSVASVHLGDSVDGLKKYGRDIDFLYLDSYDFDPNNPDPAQDHQLAEVNAATPWLTDRTVILLDDHGIQHEGKTGKSIKRLRELGFDLIFSDYQAMLLKHPCMSAVRL